MVFGRFISDENGRSCYRPDVPVFPPIEEVVENLQSATLALNEFDRRVSELGVVGTVGRLFARLDAVHSSGAEGSTTTFTDLMEYESVPDSAPDPDDAQTVAACAEAFEASLDTPNPVDAVLSIHKRLFAKDTDAFKANSAGSFKKMPNGTYDADSPTGTFYYTHPAQLSDALKDWLAFTMATDAKTPELLRQMCSHWMFESIHPVADGNGRIGRLLIPLVLKWKGTTRSGSAFIGESVHADKDIYIEALKDVRRNGDFTHWCNISLSFLRQTADMNIERLDRLAEISLRWKGQLEGVRRDSVLHRMVPWMLTKPAFTVKDASTELNVSFPVANNALQALEEKGIVALAGAGKRNRLFLASEVLDVFDRFRRLDETTSL
jgi:Fic family protein